MYLVRGLEMGGPIAGETICPKNIVMIDSNLVLMPC